MNLIVVVQKIPAVGDEQRGDVADGEFFFGLKVVQNTAEVHGGGGEVQVGVVDLSVQLHGFLVWVLQETDFKKLRKKTSEIIWLFISGSKKKKTAGKQTVGNFCS